MKTLRLFVIVLAVFTIVMAGCTKSTDNGGGGGVQGALGWALDIARGESPVNDLFWIWGVDVQANGVISEEGIWVFFFVDLNGSREEFFQVAVYSTGHTYSSWHDSDDWSITAGIPGYRDAEGWVTAADKEVTGYDYTHRHITVWAGDDEYQDTDNICAIQYTDEYEYLLALVIVNADTNEIVDVWFSDH